MKEEEHLRYLQGAERRNRNENVFARPNGLRENPEIVIPCRGPGPARTKREERGTSIPVVNGRRKKMHRCALVAKQYRAQLT